MLLFATSRSCRRPAHLACLRLRLRLRRLNLESVSCLTTIPLQCFTAQCHDNTPQAYCEPTRSRRSIKNGKGGTRRKKERRKEGKRRKTDRYPRMTAQRAPLTVFEVGVL